MPKVRANADARWARRTAASTEDYVSGVQNPRADWQQATIAAAPAQAAAVQAAIARGAFQKGVSKAGTARWQAKSAGKGAQRFGSGVADAQGDYQAAVQPYLDVIAATVLPPRGPKGDPRNLQRVAVMANALRAKKTGGVPN